MKNWMRFLLPVAIVLVGILFGQKILQNKQNKAPVSGYLQTIKGVSEGSIDGLLISDEKGTLYFNKQNDSWMLDGKKADSEKVSNIISIILNIDGANYDLVSQNPNRFNDLNVSSQSASIRLSSGGTEKLNIIVGSSSYPGNFIRPAKENNVYLTVKSLGNISTADRQNYLDKAILSASPGNIQKIYIDNTKEKYTLIKTDNKWKIENSSDEIDEGKLNGLLSNLVNLKSDKVVEDSTEKDKYKQNYGSFRIETTDSKSESLNVLKGKSDVMLVRVSDDQLFTILQTTMDEILKPSKDLLK